MSEVVGWCWGWAVGGWAVAAGGDEAAGFGFGLLAEGEGR